MRLFWRPLLLWPVISIHPTSRVLATWVPPSSSLAAGSLHAVVTHRCRSAVAVYYGGERRKT
jgi:hypothetical protein